jgi:hypothetical protein
MAHVRRLSCVALSLVVLTALGYSALTSVPHSWRLMRSQYVAYRGYSRAERDQAFITAIPVRADIFDFWRQWLRPGDRYWIQIPPEAFSANADKRLVVRTVAHLYLLPAIEAPDLGRADVVLSWDSDPGLLHLRYAEQHRAGLQLIFVSRVAHAP